jgi:prepilin-type N-terminal cleavage/methylation domain-containing protein
MKKTFSQKKSAFSLIELSIVLIIIGLLIAGITGGASLIKSSELRSVMGEARAYATSVNGFYTQFSALPGDFATVIGLSGGGDADSHIEYGVECDVASDSGDCTEGSNAWIQMLGAGVIDSNSITGTDTIDTTATSPTFGVNMPSSKIKSAGWGFDYRSSESNFEQNVLVLTGAISTGSYIAAAGESSTASITPVDALSIDTKIDDGNAYRGKVRGVDVNDDSSCYATTTYATINTTKKCALSYQIDVNS